MAHPARHNLFKPFRGVQIEKAHPLAKGLVVCWLFNEGTGNLLHDLSGNRNHGTLTLMVPSDDWIAGNDGFALDLDGGNDSIEFGTNEIIDISQPFTVVFKINPDDFSTANTIVVLNSTINFVCFISPGGNFSEITFGGNGLSANPRVDFPGTIIGNWWHFIAVFNGGALNVESDWTIYINGVSVTVNSGGNLSGVPSINTFGGDRNYNGQVSLFMLYNRELSANDAMSLYVYPYAMF